MTSFFFFSSRRRHTRSLCDRSSDVCSSDLGEVHAVSVMPKPANPAMAGREPYVVALVDLDEGVRMMSTVVTDDPWSVSVGDRLALAWEPLSDGRHLYVWERAA